MATVSQRKLHVFRVTGLLRELPDEDLKTAVQEALNDNFTHDESKSSDTQRVALVQFGGGVPQFLHELRVNPLGDSQIEMGDEDINFDCHFFGFTQLYTTDDKEPVVAE
ncbi:hypothetical protein PENSUB_4719 [Penicillium subrubescens]|uniref:Uncharacterized protein n=1 Tax=Penicillium subrubescens TaxID=1316194 RepID=A0A1Q5UBM8_9EURO|nr:hypothetical protein PENSUB_4719 [Penicillium subrubescens]